jgi:hypothetical protein
LVDTLGLIVAVVVTAAHVDDPLKDTFLHSGTNDFLNNIAPNATLAKFKGSPGVNFTMGIPGKPLARGV